MYYFQAMTNSRPRIALPTILLCLFLLLTNVIGGAYAGMHYLGGLPMLNFRFFNRLVVWCLIGFWLKTDGRSRRIEWIDGMGLFPYLVWPFIMPYYLWQTRGLRAILPVLAIVGILVTTVGIGGIVYTIFIP